MSLSDTAFENDDVGSTVSDSFSSTEDTIVTDLKIKSKVTIYEEDVDIDSIVTSSFKKVSRSDTLVGLSGLVREWGVVSPIHVLKLEDDDAYLLLDGLRRLFGAVRSGKKEIRARVWDFSDKEEGKSLANIISLVINRSHRFSSKELWDQMKILEQVNDLNPGAIEFLLQMSSGDAMKLKDVMLSDQEYAEIRNNVLSGVLSIDQGYKKLCSERRKENRLLKDDAVVIDVGVSSKDKNELQDDEQRLDIETVKDLLDLTNEDVGDLSLEDIDRSEEARGGNVYQDPKDRKPIDPTIKKAVLIRDGFRCRCCGIGGHEGWGGIIVYHHIIPVFLHGPDSVENGLSLCSNCHLTLHLYAFGKVSVRLDELSDKEQSVFRNIFKFGNILIEAMKRVRIDKDTAYKADAGSRRHLYPGEGLSDNRSALKEMEHSSAV